MIFLDESGFLLQPLRRDTWGPVGETVTRYAWDRHDRLSAICALTAAPWARRFGLYYRIWRHNITHHEVIEFVSDVHHHLRRPVILVWDRSKVHRSAAAWFSRKSYDWFHVSWLPAYAPELDPVEYVWTHAKYVELVNWIPDNIDQVERRLSEVFEIYRHDPDRLYSFFQTAELDV